METTLSSCHLVPVRAVMVAGAAVAFFFAALRLQLGSLQFCVSVVTGTTVWSWNFRVLCVGSYVDRSSPLEPS